MLECSRILRGVHGGFSRSGGNFRKNNWAKGRLDVGRILVREPLADLKFKKPKDITKHGFPLAPRTPSSEKSYSDKFCNMSILHEQDVRRYGMSVSDRSALDASQIAMGQRLTRK